MYDGIFTLENIETGAYRTFKLETMKPDAKFAPGEQVISLLSGPANRHDYQGFGFVHDLDFYHDSEGNEYRKPRIKVWKSKSGIEGEKSEFQKIGFLLECYWNRVGSMDRRYRILQPVPCTRCGELLTVPVSIARSMGPYCARQK